MKLSAVLAARCLLACAILWVAPRLASGEKATPAILVEKKSHTLTLAYYEEGAFRKIDAIHATLGKVKGDKEEQDDLKTPEGIYILESAHRPPALKAKFGDLAFMLNYPNSYDQIAGRTGFDIMLHATNEPERLKLDYDSQGCVVVNNDEIRRIEPHVKLGLTPMLIFEELGDEYLSPGKDARLASFLQEWVNAWESRSVDRYIALYHGEFSAQGMDRARWRDYKSALVGRYATISVGPEDARFYRHPKYSMITFTQNYRSTLKGGGIGHRSRGTKILYVAEEGGSPRIITESYTTRMW